MEISVRGFRGCERADLVLEPIALVAGQNFQGKSSICQAVAAALTGEAIPFFDSAKPDKARFTKSAAKELTRTGMKSGYVEVKNDGQVLAGVEWPKFTVSGTGQAQCSKIATGLVDPLAMDETERQKFFAGLLGSEPERDDFMVACMDAQIPEARAGTVWTSVQQQGWDVTHKGLKESGARLKGAWEVHSGTPYGAQKASGWRPEGWATAMESETLETAEASLRVAMKQVEAKTAQLAVSGAEIESLQARSAEEAQARADMDKSSRELDAALKARDADRQDLTLAVIPKSLPCKHCGGLLDVRAVNGKTELFVAEHSPQQIMEATTAHLAAQNKLDASEAHLTAIQKRRNEAAGRLAAVQGSTERLDAAKTKTLTQDDVDLARDQARSYERARDAVRARSECDRLFGEIASNQKLVDMLAPEGLRRQKLVKAVGTFNSGSLAPLCTAAGFVQIMVGEDLDLLYAGRKYFLLSESEQYRAAAVLRVAIAQQDGSPVCIFDRADVLDQEGRNGLFDMLTSVGDMGFLVAMTLDEPAHAPDLAGAGVGNTYWMTEGIAGPLQPK